MNRRERMLAALKHEIPDMVPCSPGLDYMKVIKMSKRPFWDFFMGSIASGPVGRDYSEYIEQYVKAYNYFNGSAILYHANPIIKQDDVRYEEKIIDKNSSRIITRTVMKTPEGDLWSETLYPVDGPPFPVRKFVKNFKEDFKFIKYFYPNLNEINFSPVYDAKNYLDDAGIIALTVSLPSLVDLDSYVDGGLGKLGLLYYDYPELIDEYKEIQENWTLEYTNKIIEAKCCDEIFIGASGLMTWQSPQIIRKLSLGTIQKITKLCSSANLTSHLHCCGFEKVIVQLCHDETELNVIEPLEVPPQGDCDLRDIKEKFGKKLVLKGNLHTSMMRFGSLKTIEDETKKCIDDAAEGGGYILSTGDQIGRDTPDENIFKLVEVCEKYGKY